MAMRRWNEKDHPRNPEDGRFRDKIGGGGWARRISDAIGRRRGERDQRREDAQYERDRREHMRTHPGATARQAAIHASMQQSFRREEQARAAGDTARADKLKAQGFDFMQSYHQPDPGGPSRLSRMEDGTGSRDPRQVGGRPIEINGQTVGYESTGPGIRGVNQDEEGLPRGRLEREFADVVKADEAAHVGALNESKHQIITTYVDDLFEVAEDIQNGVFQHDFEEDPDLEDLVNAMADVVMDRPDNWGAMQSAAERLRKYIIRSGYANVAKLPRRPPESTWRRD
jgi:hypothetical protein